MQSLFLMLTTIFGILIAIDDRIIGGLLFWLGAMVVWFSAYQGISALRHIHGSPRLATSVVQLLFMLGGFWLLGVSKAGIGFFGIGASGVQYGYVCMALGAILAMTSRPPQAEIDSVNSGTPITQ